nr:EOG090X0LTN [Eulimnadia texana]
MDEPRAPPRNSFEAFCRSVYSLVDTPVTWFREQVVTPNRPDTKYYHQKFRRVPTIDECYTDDRVCHFEAEHQFKRDKLVDEEIVSILRQRMKECLIYESPDHQVKCAKIIEDYEKAAENWFIKYGDMGPTSSVVDAYMKQKHRMIWERRHGPVGMGMKNSKELAAH